MPKSPYRVYWRAGPFLAVGIHYLFTQDEVGAEQLPASGPLIFAANHLSPSDTIVLCDVYWKRTPRQMLHFMAKEEVFSTKLGNWFFKGSGQIPVMRSTDNAADSLIHARSMLLDEKEIVAIFPEGTISPGLVPMRPHTGVGRLALDTGVPVACAGIWGTHRTITKFRKRDLKRHRPVTVNIDEPVVYTEADGDAVAVTEHIMNRIIRLTDAARARYPEKPGPNDWWGPPEWPLERAGKWRPKLHKKMSAEEALAVTAAALRGDDDVPTAESTGEDGTGAAGAQ